MSYKTVRKELADQSAGSGRCLVCGDSTAHETLALHGAMCFRCFTGYCREPFVASEPSRAAQAIRKEIAAMGKL